ncbi:MAG: LysM peptidoglycan-binding domain-containing protein [Patescibacteria group bacterium]
MKNKLFPLFVCSAFLLVYLPVFASVRNLPDYPSQTKLDFKFYTVKKGDSFFRLFKNRWEIVARFNRIDERHLIVGMKIKVPVHLEAAENYSPLPEFIENANTAGKQVLIDLEEQFLGAYENSRLVFSAPISSADPGCLDENGREKICYTPEGVFKAMAFHRDHQSSIYQGIVSGENIPMPFAVMFYLEAV